METFQERPAVMTTIPLTHTDEHTTHPRVPDYPRDTPRGAQFAELCASLAGLPVAATVSDPHLPDNPLVFVNDAFVELTGYSRDVSLCRNCRFLQGPETDQLAVVEIREAVEHAHPIGIDLVNHRHDGSGFINSLLITPIRLDGELSFYLGLQTSHDPG